MPTIAFSRPDQPPPGTAKDWPIVKGWIPHRHIWEVTGLGIVCIIRRSPAGKCWSSLFTIHLARGGLTGVYCRGPLAEADQLAYVERLDRELRIPPMQEGTPQQIARYARGALAWSLAHGGKLAKPDLEPAMALVPRLGGTVNWWLQQFVEGDDPVVWPRLLQALRENALIGRGAAEPPITVSVVYRLDDEAAALAALSAEPRELPADPNGPPGCFTWTSPSTPAAPPLRAMVRVSGGKLTATAMSLTAGAELIRCLTRRLGDRLSMEDVSWANPRKLAGVIPDSEKLTDRA